MKLLSRHFKDVEFFCHCGNCDPHESTISKNTVMALQKIRNTVKVPLKITSGIRCQAHNDSIEDAAKNSWHVPRATPELTWTEDSRLRPKFVSYAADFTYSDPDKRTMEEIMLLYILADQDYSVTGLGLYRGRIHLDTRPEGRARWINKKWGLKS